MLIAENIITYVLLPFIFFFADKKLVPDDDPENAKHEFAFDNLAFKGEYNRTSYFSMNTREGEKKT